VIKIRINGIVYSPFSIPFSPFSNNTEVIL